MINLTIVDWIPEDSAYRKARLTPVLGQENVFEIEDVTVWKVRGTLLDATNLNELIRQMNEQEQSISTLATNERGSINTLATTVIANITGLSKTKTDELTALATSLTNSYNSNHNAKMELYNNNATNKTNEFNTTSQTAIDYFQNNYQAILDALENAVTLTYLQENYYNKVEVDNKISEIPAPDMSEYYKKTETYNKTEVDGFAVKLTGNQTITGTKNFSGVLQFGGKQVATEEFVNNLVGVANQTLEDRLNGN